MARNACSSRPLEVPSYSHGMPWRKATDANIRGCYKCTFHHKMERKHATVLIAGGSIAGLTLAKSLELAGIDYVVLEKYAKIAPDLGASIALFPNAARILDQIGCWDAVEELYNHEDVYNEINAYDDKGVKLKALILDEPSQHLRRSLGYQMVFIDRQQMVQILYDSLKDKSRGLVNQGVMSVETYPGGVRVHTKNNDTFTGEILVGADEVPTEWRCIYGISKPASQFPPNTSSSVMGMGYSYLCATGPGGRIYWFMSDKLPQKVRGLYEKVPRYTNDDLDQAAIKHANDDIAGMPFRDLYETRTSASLQALPEMTLSKSYYGRMVVIGDAAHKYNPIGGQGGAQAIEDAAVLTNLLHKRLQTKATSPFFPDSDVEEILSTFQAKRYERCKIMQDGAHTMQKLQGMEGLIPKLMIRFILPLTGKGSWLVRIAGRCAGGARLDFVKMPHRPHSIVYDNEKPAAPFKETKMVPLLFAVSAIALFIGARKTITFSYPVPFPDNYLGVRLPQTLFGIPGIDKVMVTATIAMSRPVGWIDLGATLHLIYLLGLLFPIFIIWYIEGYRKGSRWSFIACPLLYGMLMHGPGIGAMMPFYCLMGLWVTRSAPYVDSMGSKISTSVAKAILPANILGIVLPTIAMFTGILIGKENLPYIIFTWSNASIWVSALIWFLSKHYERVDKPTHDPKWDEYYRDDLPHLATAYKVSFIISSLTHIAVTLCTAISSDPGVTFSRLLLPNHDPLAGTAQEDIFHAHSFKFLKWDLNWTVAGTVWWGVYNIYELRRRGLITTKEFCCAQAVFLAAHPIVGPGAALMGLWAWREPKIMQRDTSEMDLKGQETRKGNGKVG
ncbi:FAD-dependent monooxygenase janM [Pseudocercospora fuligena]|uniref:FAD-dependent monooxygenase janM n=1 Tax=Pseudocercospora fuligena TaxID=685502 RepID=A0A8H6RI33_9PEZI|nr:FAD-dependent monooxygenase janM [Pseudocercospora fuligena]